MKTGKQMIYGRTGAFTLIELLMALTISGFVLTGMFVMLVSGSKSFYNTANRLTTNYDERKMTQGFEDDAAFATQFYIFDVDTNGTISATSTPVPQGQSGDLLLLITTSAANNGSTTVNRIVAYSRGNPEVQTTTTNSSSINLREQPIYRYDTGANTNLNVAGTTPIATLYLNYIKTPLSNMITNNRPYLPTGYIIGTAFDNPAPQSPAPAQKHDNLFYNLGGGTNGNGAFMVLAQVYEQTKNGQTELSIDTYNLTMWPRS